MFVGRAHSHLLHDPQQRNDMSQETDKNSNRQATVRIHILQFNSDFSQLEGASNNSDFVIPAKGGIQCFQSTGHRPVPVRRIIRDSLDKGQLQAQPSLDFLLKVRC